MLVATRQQVFHSHYVAQPVLVLGTAYENWKVLLEQSFTCTVSGRLS